MPVDIVDVSKSVFYWEKRRIYNEFLFGLTTFTRLNSLITDLEITIANEYYCHEAGHLIGYDVEAKYEDGYFRFQNRPAWPLIFVEELRADLHSFGYALELLPQSLAIQTFLYNIALRFGLEAYSIQHDSQSYGWIPYLLFYLLYNLGFIRVIEDRKIKRKRMELPNLQPEYIISCMRACADHAELNFTQIELEKSDRIDMAINAASYFRQRALDYKIYSLYSEVMTSPANCGSNLDI